MPISKLLAQADPAEVFGRVEPPEGVTRFDQAAGGGDAIGLIVFISAGIRIFTIVAGLFVMLNLFLAGFEYITAGDSKATSTGCHRVRVCGSGHLCARRWRFARCATRLVARWH